MDEEDNTNQFQLKLKDYENQYLLTKKSYILSIKQNNKQLHSLLKMKFRVDNIHENDTIQKLLQIIEIFARLNESLHESLESIQEVYSQYNEFKNKAKSSEQIINKFEEVKNTYQNQIQEQRDYLEQLQLDNQQLKSNQTLFQKQIQERDQKIISLQNQKDSIVNDLQLQKAEINKLEIEKNYHLKQNDNFNSLFKQVKTEQNLALAAGEKDQKYKEFSQRILFLQQQFDNCQDDYQQKLSEKDDQVQSLNRQVKMLEKKVDLNNDLDFIANLSQLNTVEEMMQKQEKESQIDQKKKIKKKQNFATPKKVSSKKEKN